MFQCFSNKDYLITHVRYSSIITSHTTQVFACQMLKFAVELIIYARGVIYMRQDVS